MSCVILSYSVVRPTLATNTENWCILRNVVRPIQKTGVCCATNTAKTGVFWDVRQRNVVYFWVLILCERQKTGVSWVIMLFAQQEKLGYLSLKKVYLAATNAEETSVMITCHRKKKTPAWLPCNVACLTGLEYPVVNYLIKSQSKVIFL